LTPFRILFFLECCYSLLFAGQQESLPFIVPDSSRIVNILIVGNKKTKSDIILREMTVKAGDFYVAEKIEQDRKQIQNLHLFTRVEIQPTLVDAGIVLVIDVSERWYIVPYPILYYNEKDWKKLSYGAGIIYQNFRGRNIDLVSSFWLGYNPGMQAYYSVPWFGGSLKLYSQIEVFYKKVRSVNIEVPQFDEVQRGILTSLGKRWGHYTYLFLQLGYRDLSVPDEFKSLTFSKNGTDRLPSMGLYFRYDKRDLYEYPKQGWLLDLYVQKTLYKNYANFVHYGTDVRHYFLIWKKSALAMRTAADLTHGTIPVYDRLFIGYAERIRGHFTELREGNQRFLGSIEFRFPIINVRYYDIGVPLLFGDYGTNLPFGVSGAFFYDTGAVWKKLRALNKTDFLSGFGAGLHFHVPYVDLIRFEYALDTHRKSEFILDLYTWF
jgi:outer membrane protein assembly factor BamA